MLLLVGGASYLLSASARRLSALSPEDREYQGWVGRDKTLCVSLFQVGLVIVGASLIAWEEHLDILTDDYLRAFRPGHVRAAAVVWVVGLFVFWCALAGRMNFRLLQVWLGRESPVLFEGAVQRVRVEIFSDGVYAASATGLMIELLNGLLHAQEKGEGGHEGGGGTVWPGLINYIYCFHIVAVLHRSHQNIVAKIPAFRPTLLAINCLVCLSVAFIPTLSTILDVSWHHDSASLTTGAAFLLCASLLLLLLLRAALRAAPLAEAPEGIDDSADALLSEMLGRPLARGAGILSGHILPPPSSLSMANQEEEGEEEEDEELPRHVPRLFHDPSCLPRGGGVDEDLLTRLQGIRDEYEIGSACILPGMALFLTILTASLQLVGHESPFVPVAFLLTFFVYSVEHRLLRPRAAKQIRKIQRQLRQQHHHHQGGFSSSRSHPNKGPPPMLPTLQTVREELSFTSSVGSSVGGDSEAAAEGEAKEEGGKVPVLVQRGQEQEEGFGEGGREDEVKEEEGLGRQGRLRSLSSGSGGEGEKHVHFK